MSTTVTLDEITANFTKRGVKWRYFKSRADALVHNRNKAGNNTSATPGGFGPLRGLFIHNFASDISDTSSEQYLYNGDAGRDLPGPLSQFALDDTGVWVVIGWGAANHASAGDAKVEALARADKAPLDRDLIPNAANTKTLLAPFYLGVEILYGKAPTAAQRDSLIKGAAAIMEVLGYSGGSVLGHRETHTSRSDPVGFKMFEIRKAVNSQLAQWKSPTPPPAPKPPAPQAPSTVTATQTKLVLAPNPNVRMGSTLVKAITTPAVAGIHVFEFSTDGGKTYKEFSRASAPSGISSFDHRFGGTHPVRVRFIPSAPTKYGTSSAVVTMTSVDLPV